MAILFLLGIYIQLLIYISNFIEDYLAGWKASFYWRSGKPEKWVWQLSFNSRHIPCKLFDNSMVINVHLYSMPKQKVVCKKFLVRQVITHESHTEEIYNRWDSNRGYRIRTCELVLPKHSIYYLRITNKIRLWKGYKQVSGTSLRLNNVQSM